MILVAVVLASTIGGAQPLAEHKIQFPQARISPRLGVGWYLAPLAGHGLDLGSTVLSYRRGGAELSSGFGANPSIRRIAKTKGAVCAGQILAIFVLDRLGQRGAAKTVSAVSIWPGAAGAWNFGVVLSR